MIEDPCGGLYCDTVDDQHTLPLSLQLSEDDDDNYDCDEQMMVTR